MPSIPFVFLENGPLCPNLEWDRLSTGLLVRKVPQCTIWEMVGQWNGWKNDVSILRMMASQRTHENIIMAEGISESCDGDLHTIL